MDLVGYPKTPLCTASISPVQLVMFASHGAWYCMNQLQKKTFFLTFKSHSQTLSCKMASFLKVHHPSSAYHLPCPTSKPLTDKCAHTLITALQNLLMLFRWLAHLFEELEQHLLSLAAQVSGFSDL